jgi:hypothetical protein
MFPIRWMVSLWTIFQKRYVNRIVCWRLCNIRWSCKWRKWHLSILYKNLFKNINMDKFFAIPKLEIIWGFNTHKHINISLHLKWTLIIQKIKEIQIGYNPSSTFNSTNCWLNHTPCTRFNIRFSYFWPSWCNKKWISIYNIISNSLKITLICTLSIVCKKTSKLILL